MGSIRDTKLFVERRWDWTKWGYEDGMPRGCAFGDIDAFQERNGRFLFVECKEHVPLTSFRPLPRGQELGLERLAKVENVTVLVVYGVAISGDPHLVHNLSTGEKWDWSGKPLTERRSLLRALFESCLEVVPVEASSSTAGVNGST